MQLLMKNGQIFQHFGHTEAFKIYDIADDKVVSAEVVDTNGSGHGALAGFLVAHGVDTLICGGIGGGAQNALAQAGIRLFRRSFRKCRRSCKRTACRKSWL